MAVGVSKQGEKYEKHVKQVVRKASAKIANLTVVPDGGSTFNRTGVDMKLKIKSVPYFFEIKESTHAQMGGTAINYYNQIFSFPSEENIDENIKEILKDNLKKMPNDLEKLLAFLRKQEPTDINKKNDKLPIRCSVDAWNAAQTKGLLRPLNVNIAYNSEFISNHYSKKDVHYIQIGGAGLFHLKKNPLNLPIPKLDSDINIELRLARGGAVYNSTYKVFTLGANIRAQARLKTKSKSKFSLDEESDVLMMFGKF